MGTELVPWIFTTGWASGVNAYATVLVLGLLGRYADVSQVPHGLTRTDVLIPAAVLFTLEFVADKIPYVDSLWDALHTIVRPSIGAVIGALLAGNDSSLSQIFAATSGGVIALVSHLAKAGLRAAVNTSPEPASNLIVSSGEDITVAGLVALASAHPWVSAGIAAALLAASVVLVVKLWRRVLAFRARWRGRWAQ
jgi:Domain of unknown function (DUF4126)